MVEIELTKGYRLVSDRYNWMIVRVNGGREFYEGYYSNLPDAINSFVQRKMRECEARSIETLDIYVKSLIATLNKALQPINFQLVKLKDIKTYVSKIPIEQISEKYILIDKKPSDKTSESD